MFFNQLGWVMAAMALLTTEALTVITLHRVVKMPSKDIPEEATQGLDALASLLFINILVCGIGSGLALGTALHQASWGVALAITAVSTGLYFAVARVFKPQRQGQQAAASVALLKEQQP